jgi:hypothetical protein
MPSTSSLTGLSEVEYRIDHGCAVFRVLALDYGKKSGAVLNRLTHRAYLVERRTVGYKHVTRNRTVDQRES